MIKRMRIAQGAACFILALAVSACVPTVSYTSSTPDSISAHKALAAERSLTHGQARTSRRIDPNYTEMSFCSAEGARVVIHSVRVTETGVCGKEMVLSTAALSTEQKPERCWGFGEISTIGQPRDATVVGYYPVRGYLRCPA